MNQTVNETRLEVDPKDAVALDKLLAQYGPAFDKGNPDAYSRLFTQDGQLSFPDGAGGITLIKGREALVQFAEQAYQSSKGSGVYGFHSAGKTIFIQKDCHTVHAYTPVTMVMQQSGAQQAVSIMSVGQYVDVIVKEGCEWKFKSRTADSYISGPLPDEFL